MMKKTLLAMFAIALLFGAPGCGKRTEQEREKKAIEKQEKKKHKSIEQEEKRLKNEEKQLREEIKNKEEKEQKRLRKEEKRLKNEEKQIRKEVKNKEKKEQRLLRKAEEKAKKLEKKQKKQERLERKRLEKEENKIERKQEKLENKLNPQNRKQEKEAEKREKLEKKGKLKTYLDKIFAKEERIKDKKAQEELKSEKRESKRQARIEEESQIKEKRELKRQELDEKKLNLNERRLALMDEWKEIRRKEVEQDYADGVYADLYKLPTWPFDAYFAQYHKDLFYVNLHYNYETNSYNSKGSSQDVTKLAFGEQSFTFNDILLALRLNQKETLKPSEAFAEDATISNDATWNMLLGKKIGFQPVASDPASYYYWQTNSGAAFGYYNKNLIFNGEVQEYGLSLDFLRNLKGQDIAFGFQIPIAYKSHELKLDSNVGQFDDDDISTANDGMQQGFSIPYRTQLKEILNYVLEPKNLRYNEKNSIMGIGDISTFLNFQFNSRHVEKLGAGIKVVWPTAKEKDSGKLWAPELGNNCTQLSAFLSTIFHKQRTWCNPHMFIEGIYKLPGHVNKRVPKKIQDSDKLANNSFTDVMAHGDNVTYNSLAFTEWDTNVTAFADNVQSVKLRQGAEVNVRLGNIFEKFIYRRAFLDIYYNFRAKWEDSIWGGLPEDVWNVAVLSDNTQQLEHKIGIDYSHQFDERSRLRLGLNYVFAGINVPSTVQATFALGYEF